MANRVVTLDEGLATVLKTVLPLSTEIVPLSEMLHRVLAVNVLSGCDMPPFDKSAMDGFAIKQEEIGLLLKISGEATAGAGFLESVKCGEAVRIMTGAPVPEGANMVVMKEVAIEKDGSVSFHGAPKNSNICYKGEDVKTGNLVLEKGSCLTSRHIAVLASAGYSEAEVYRQPRVAIFATGNELVEPGKRLKKDTIYNSNAHQLVAECQTIGLQPNYLGILADTFEGVLEPLKEAIKNYDAIILSGGVSVGEYDFIPLVLKELKFNIKFDTMATKPGKHTVFATNGSCYILGLPGNPVSTLTQFEMVGKVLLGALQGISILQNRLFKAPLNKSFSRRGADRLEFLPAIINSNGEVELLNYHGSAHISALTNATHLAQIALGTTTINKGDLVDVRPL